MRVGGLCWLKIDSENFHATEGEFTYSLGLPKRSSVFSGSNTIGYTEEPTAPFVEGEIFALKDIDIKKLISSSDQTVTLELANGTTFRLSGAWFCGDGELSSNGRMKVRFEGKTASIDS